MKYFCLPQTQQHTAYNDRVIAFSEIPPVKFEHSSFDQILRRPKKRLPPSDADVINDVVIVVVTFSGFCLFQPFFGLDLFFIDGHDGNLGYWL